MDLGEKIQFLRKQNNMTLEQVGNIVGVGKSTVRKWESGDIANMRRDKIAKLADALHTTPAYLMGWEESSDTVDLSASSEDDFFDIPIVADVAAHYNSIANGNSIVETVRVDRSHFKGRAKSEFCAMRVKDDSMLPKFEDGDIVVLLLQTTMNRSGQIGVVSYGNEEMTLKRIHYVEGEDWLELEPINSLYPKKRISGYDLQDCHIIGIPKLLIREFE